MQSSGTKNIRNWSFKIVKVRASLWVRVLLFGSGKYHNCNFGFFQALDYITSDYDDVCTKNLYKNGCDFTQSPDSDIYLQIDVDRRRRPKSINSYFIKVKGVSFSQFRSFFVKMSWGLGIFLKMNFIWSFINFG